MKKLFKKELLGEKNWIIGFCCFVFGVNFLLFPLTRITEGFMAIMAIFLTLPGFFLMSLVRAFLIWKDEWDSNTGFTLFSLPVKGYNLVLSKMGVLGIEIFLYILFVFLVPYLILKGYSYNLKVDSLTFFKLWFLTGFRIFLFVPFAMVSYLLGRVFSLGRGWITAGSFVGLLIIYSRYLYFGRKIFSSLPEVFMKVTIMGDVETFSLSLATLMATFIFSVFLTFASCFLVEKVEI
ncbi:MAG: hypothetical protein ABIN61_00715 [candidate division WOR-3 bacterium]